MTKQKITHDEIIKMFKDTDLYCHAVNIKVMYDDTINFINSTTNNKVYEYKQNFELVYLFNDGFFAIQNHDLPSSEFLDFTDKHTFKNFKSAFKKFVKLSYESE